MNSPDNRSIAELKELLEIMRRRAFGIFAAVSLVRFRTNIRDPKEITVLLISLAIGLGTGVQALAAGISQ
ncbi:MAG: hypothetical protein ACREBG_28420 [Pyrinomonadaceae bacterium]